MYNVIYISCKVCLYSSLLQLKIKTGAQKENMETININELQAQISKVIRNVEAGETYEVMRYSRPVAVIVPKRDHKKEKTGCDLCHEKLDIILKKLS